MRFISDGSLSASSTLSTSQHVIADHLLPGSSDSVADQHDATTQGLWPNIMACARLTDYGAPVALADALLAGLPSRYGTHRYCVGGLARALFPTAAWPTVHWLSGPPVDLVVASYA